MIFCIFKAIGGWLLIVILSTNLIGFLVRGLFLHNVEEPDFDDDDVSQNIKRQFESMERRRTAANLFLNLIAAVMICAYLFSLYHYWNIFLALAGAISMVSRLPDLIWEIRTGRKQTEHDKPDGFIYMIDVPLMLLNLPLIWYALCMCGP